MLLRARHMLIACELNLTASSLTMHHASAEHDINMVWKPPASPPVLHTLLYSFVQLHPRDSRLQHNIERMNVIALRSNNYQKWITAFGDYFKVLNVRNCNICCTRCLVSLYTICTIHDWYTRKLSKTVVNLNKKYKLRKNFVLDNNIANLYKYYTSWLLVPIYPILKHLAGLLRMLVPHNTYLVWCMHSKQLPIAMHCTFIDE